MEERLTALAKASTHVSTHERLKAVQGVPAQRATLSRRRLRYEVSGSIGSGDGPNELDVHQLWWQFGETLH